MPTELSGDQIEYEIVEPSYLKDGEVGDSGLGNMEG